MINITDEFDMIEDIECFCGNNVHKEGFDNEDDSEIFKCKKCGRLYKQV